MATIVATLNAASPGTQADNVTTDANLTYKVYNDVDSYAAAESFGKHGTAGVTVSLGVVTITGVTDVGITSFKISSVDEAGNESVLSDAYGVSIILFEDDFTGATIDTVTNWTKFETTTARMEFTQNDELISTAKGVGTQVDFALNYLVGKTGINLATLQVVAFDILKGTDNAHLWGVGITPNATPDIDNYFAIRKSNIENNIQLRDRVGAVNGSTIEAAVDIETTMQSFKIVIDADAKMYHWNGSAWVQIGTTISAHGYSGTWYPFISMNDSTSGTNFLNVDNFVVTDSDFATLRPV